MCLQKGRNENEKKQQSHSLKRGSNSRRGDYRWQKKKGTQGCLNLGGGRRIPDTKNQRPTPFNINKRRGWFFFFWGGKRRLRYPQRIVNPPKGNGGVGGSSQKEERKKLTTPTHIFYITKTHIMGGGGGYRHLKRLGEKRSTGPV